MNHVSNDLELINEKLIVVDSGKDIEAKIEMPH